MGRKGKRRAKQRRASELPAIKTESAEAVEQQSNVIQFRAKTAVAHGASQVAVNDDVTSDAPTSRREPSEARRIEEDDLTDEQDRPSEPHAMDAETSPGTLDAPEALAAPAETAEASDEDDHATEAAADETAEAAPVSEPPPQEDVAEAATEEVAAEAAVEEPAAAEPVAEASQPSEPPAAADEATLDRASGIEERAPEVEETAAVAAVAVATEEKPEDAPQETKAEQPEEKAAATADDKSARKRRPKAEGTTSSATIKALTITGEHPMVAEDFFRAPNYEAQREETWDDLKKVVEPLPPGVKRARMATYWIGGTAAVAIGGWLLYSKVFSVQPDPEVGGLRVADLPDVASISAAMNEASPETAPREAAVPAETEMEEVAEATETAEATEAETAEATEAETAETTEAAEATEAETAETTEAETAAETPVEPAPPTGEYATLLAEAQRLRGRRAEDAYRAAIAANPNGVEALAPLAFSLLNRRQNQEAADLAARAVAVDATNSQAWITLGAARQELRDAAGARQAYQSCVDQGQGRYVSDCRLMLQSMR